MLLIPTVTSPSFRSCPFFTLSSVGPDSATQSLCSGSVNTPTLGKLIVLVTVAIVALFRGRGALLGEGRGGEARLVKFAFWSPRTVVEGDVLFAVVLCKRSGAPVVVQAWLSMDEYLNGGILGVSNRRRRIKAKSEPTRNAIVGVGVE